MANSNRNHPEMDRKNSKNALQINSAVIHKTTSLPTPRNSIESFPMTKGKKKKVIFMDSM